MSLYMTDHQKSILIIITHILLDSCEISISIKAPVQSGPVDLVRSSDYRTLSLCATSKFHDHYKPVSTSIQFHDL